MEERALQEKGGLTDLIKKSVAALLPLIAISILIPTGFIPRVHATPSGEVCIASIADVSTRCPASGPIFNGPLTTPNTLLRVPIMINNTDTFNGFDITINSTRDSSGHSVLRPFGVDLTGSIIPANSIPLAECAGSFSIVGSSCGANATIDNPTTVRAAIIFPSFLPTGTTGLLFTAIFVINGTTMPSGVTIAFQNHCDPNESSSGQLCVAIGNGTRIGPPENVQTGGFDNSDITTLPYVTLSTTSTDLGQFLFGEPNHSLPTVAFTATSQNGFQTSPSPQIALATSFNGTGVRPTVALNPTALDLTGLTASSFTQTGNLPSSVPAGVYIATVTATYLTSDLITFTTDYLSASYSLTLTVTDYSLSINASSIAITPPSSQVVTVRITPKASFNNLVKLELAVPSATLAAGITATLNPLTIPSGSGTSTLTVMTNSNTSHGKFALTVTSNTTLSGFTTTHVATLTINTIGPDFSISANPSLVILSPPGNVTIVSAPTITLTSFNFIGSVQLATSVAPIGLGVTLGTTSLLLPLNGQNQTTLIPLFFGSTPPGTYHVTVTGTAGSVSHMANVTLIVPSVQGDFGLSANPILITLTAGSASATTTITVTSVAGFSGTVQLGASSFGPLAFSFNPVQLSLASGSLANSSLTITGLNAFPGTFLATVTGTHTSNANGTSTTISHSVQITVQVLAAPNDFQIETDFFLTSNRVLAGSNGIIEILVPPIGPRTFNDTVMLTGQVSPLIGNSPTLSFDRVQVTPFSSGTPVLLTVSTTVLTPPGNYTITITGTNVALVHSAQLQIVVLPPPVLTLTPSSGPVGTQVTVHGSGFVNTIPSSVPFPVELTFDGQFLGTAVANDGSFNLTFNVPISQAGISHSVHAVVDFFLISLDVQAGFSVTPKPSALTVSVSSGAIYFPGDTVTIFAMTTMNGQTSRVSILSILLLEPTGSNVTLGIILVSMGVYRAVFAVPTTGSTGTYAIVVKAHQAGSSDAIAIVSFEVKPTWLQSNGRNVITTTGILSIVSTMGGVTLAWKKGYFTRKREDIRHSEKRDSGTR